MKRAQLWTRFQRKIIRNLHEGQQINSQFRFMGNGSRYTDALRTTPLLLLLIPYMFLVTRAQKQR